MKVIRVDNFARESIAESEVEVGLTEAEAKTLAEDMNAASPEDGPWYYRVVQDSYRLWRGAEDLV